LRFGAVVTGKTFRLLIRGLHVIDLDLESDLSKTLPHFDLVIHFAGVTHASDEKQYWKVNLEGTRRLAQAVHEAGCRRFVYISTRCATHGSGAYGESKLAAEQELQKLDWESLLIIRPAEIYGGGGNEGIDRMLAMARKWHVVPALFGHSNLSFAPMHVDDFTKLAAELIQQHRAGTRIETLCGPEDLNGFKLAFRHRQTPARRSDTFVVACGSHCSQDLKRNRIYNCQT
jgi:nucleoside-diphosphate-sugar epimerase